MIGGGGHREMRRKILKLLERLVEGLEERKRFRRRKGKIMKYRGIG